MKIEIIITNEQLLEIIKERLNVSTPTPQIAKKRGRPVGSKVKKQEPEPPKTPTKCWKVNPNAKNKYDTFI